MKDSERTGASDATEWSRRNVVQALGAAGAAGALAGCSGDGGDGGTGTPTETSGPTGTETSGPTATQTETQTSTPTTLADTSATYKTFTQNQISGDDAEEKFVIDHWAHRPPNRPLIFQKYWYRWADEPGLLDEVEVVDDTEIRLHIDPDYGWSNGETITGEDIYIWFKIHQLMFGPGRENLSAESAGWLYGFTEETDWDDDTLYLRSSEGYFAGTADYAIKESFKGYSQAYNRFQHRSHLDSVLETAKNASNTSDPRDADSKQAITDWWWNYHLNLDNGYDWPDALTSGPMTVRELKPSTWVYEPNEHHKYADKLNWDTYELQVRDGQNAYWAAMKAGNIDGAGVTTPAHVYQNFESSYAQSLKPFPDGGGFVMNHQHEFPDGNEWFDDRRVRQAMAHIINREQLANTHHQYAAAPLEVPVSFGTIAQKRLRNADTDVNFGDFPTFGPASQQLEQANNLLSAAGLSKQKGEWVMENGDPLHLELVSTAETPDVELATLQQLGRAGIGGELNTVDDAVYSERASNYPLQYGVTLGGWSQIGNQIQSATTVYHNALRWRGYYADQRNIWERDRIQEQVDAGTLEWIQPSEEGKEPVRVKKYAPDQVEAFTIQAPPPGDWDGALQDIPIITRGQGATTQTEQDVRAHQVEMGWYRLFDMPDIPIYETWNQAFQKRDGWLLPDSDSEWWTQSPNEQISAGQISADPDAQ